MTGAISASSPQHPLYADRCAIVDATRPLMAAMPSMGFADVRNAEWCAKAHPRLVKFADRWTMLLGSFALLGKSGTGKTSSCRALCDRLRREALARGDVAHPIVGAVWANGVDYARHRRELPRGKPDLELDAMGKASFLVLDEIGQEDCQPQWLLEVLDARYRRKRPTLTTSGLTRAQLEARYGTGIARRLVEPVGQFIDLYEGAGG